MSVDSELKNYNDGLKAAFAQTVAKGATVTSVKNLANLPNAINSIPTTGFDTSNFVAIENVYNSYKIAAGLPCFVKYNMPTSKTSLLSSGAYMLKNSAPVHMKDDYYIVPCTTSSLSKPETTNSYNIMAALVQLNSTDGAVISVPSSSANFGTYKYSEIVRLDENTFGIMLGQTLTAYRIDYTAKTITKLTSVNPPFINPDSTWSYWGLYSFEVNGKTIVCAGMNKGSIGDYYQITTYFWDGENFTQADFWQCSMTYNIGGNRKIWGYKNKLIVSGNLTVILDVNEDGKMTESYSSWSDYSPLEIGFTDDYFVMRTASQFILRGWDGKVIDRFNHAATSAEYNGKYGVLMPDGFVFSTGAYIRIANQRFAGYVPISISNWPGTYGGSIFRIADGTLWAVRNYSSSSTSNYYEIVNEATAQIQTDTWTTNGIGLVASLSGTTSTVLVVRA